MIRALGAGVASLVVVAGSLTAFGAAVTLLDSAPAAAALSCNDNWTGIAGTTDWNTATNWSAGVPTSGGSNDDACIGASATVVVPNSSFAVNELTVSSGGTLTVGIGGTGTATATLSVVAGLENDGTFTAGPSGTTGNATLFLNGPTTNTGTLTTDGPTTIGNGSATTITNQGTWTLGTAATTTVGGSSSFVQSGPGAQFTDNNVANNSFADGGNLVVDGGTICGTGPDLLGGSPGGNDTLIFGSSTPAGPACGTGLSSDQIVTSANTNSMSGNVPAGYTVTTLGGATLQPTVSLTNNGAIVLDSGNFIDNTGGTVFTNAGTFDVPTNNTGSFLNVSSFNNASTGAVSVEGTLTIGNGTAGTITNDGTWTLGSAGTTSVGGSSSFVQDGVLTDNNVTNNSPTVNNNSFDVAGNLVVDGGTICGSAPDLHGGSPGGADTLIFGTGPIPGPACAGGVATDQIVASANTNSMSGNVPAGYTVTTLGGATLQPNFSLTNNGAIVLNSGNFIDNTGGTAFTNAGTFDVPANTEGSFLNVSAFNNTSTGAVSVEGTLTIGNGTAGTITNDGTWTLGPAGTTSVEGSSSFVQSGSSAQLTDNNVANNSFDEGGNLVVDGGTICGTGPNLHGGTPGGNDTLIFGSSTPAGPACGTGLSSDQIVASANTNSMSGNVPAGYTVTTLGGATLQPNFSLTNNGAIVLNSGNFIDNTGGTAFTNAGTFDVPANTEGSFLNVSAFNNTSTGAVSVEGTLTIGNGTAGTITNDGTWTLGPAGTALVGGSSSFVQDGVLTDNNVTANTFNDAGNLVVDGGTICGTAPDLHGGSPGGADTLVFGTGPIPGPDCAGGVAEDQIDASSNTNDMSGNVPAGYTVTVLGGAALQPNATLTNNGAIVLNSGDFIDNTGGTTFTNAGTFDVPTNTSGSFLNVSTFKNAASGSVTDEGTLTIGNGTATAVTNDGTIGVAPGGLINVGGSSTITNKSDGLLAFGIDGTPSSTSNYGRITNGTLVLGGSADPVFDNGFTPSPLTEYFVYTGSSGSYSGTFATVLHNATADYSHTNEVGLTGGAPATPTSTSVVSSVPSGSVFGQGVQFTATVTPTSGSNPTGSVAFYADGIYLGSASVATSAGSTTARLDVSNLRVGSESITATYTGDVVFNASTSTVLTQLVSQDPSSITVVPSPTSPVPGQQVTYTVEVQSTAPGAGTPTGDVSVTDNGTPIAGCQNLIMGPLGPSFVTCSATYQATGAHTIGASFAGDTDFTSGTGSLSLTVQPAATSTTVTSSANPGPIGGPVTYTATVSVVSPGTGTPTGTVSFTDNSSPVANCQNLLLPVTSPLQVTCSETYGSNASHSIVATYNGDANDATSNGSLTETLQQISTQTTIAASSPTSTYGQSVTYTATVTPSQSASVDPSGTVTFYDNENSPATAIGTANASTTGGVTTAILGISSLAAGPHAISATYNGDTTFTTSSSSATSLSVAQAGTTVSVASSANPSVVDQAVTFTATISSFASGETGSVQFNDGGSMIGSGAVSGGQATLQVSSLSLGNHAITAIYSGDSNFDGANSTNTVAQTVNQAVTATTVTSDHNPGTVGQTITYTATVTVSAPGGGTPTGDVSFSDGGSAISNCQNLPLPLSAPLQVTCAQVYDTNAGHAITAVYDGDANYVTSTGSLSETLSQVATTTSVAASPTSATYGQSVSLTATVAPTTGTADPTGTVTYTDNGTTTLGTSTLSTTAGVTTASMLTTTLPVGTDVITASYSGGPGFLASATTTLTSASVSMGQATTTLGLIANVNPTTFGRSVTFTATVFPGTGSGETGTVTFLDNGSSIGTGAVSNGQATLTTATLAVGTHPITATYGGDGNFTGSSTTSTLSQGVNKAPTTVALQSSLNPSTSGQSVTFTATITPVTGSGETGTVTFLDNGSSIGTGTVSNGQATLTTATLAAGTHPITATYDGDGSFSGGSTTTTLSQVVNKIAASVNVQSSLNPSNSGQSVTFTATVTPVTGSGETGTVTFFDNGMQIGTGSVSGGLATFTTATLSVTTHPITASYGGDGTFAASSPSNTVNQVVQSAQILATTTTLSSSVDPSTVSVDPTLTATVVPTGGGSGSPNFTGTVTFNQGSTVLGTSPITSGGLASITLPQLASSYAIGTHTITATYSGGTGFTGSTSSPYSQVVAPPIFTSDGFGCDFSVINSATNAVANYPESTTTTCGTYAVDYLAVSPDGTHAYLMQPTGTSTTIKVINTATGGVIATISLPAESMDLAMAPNGADLYVAERYLNQVAVISTATDTVTRNIPVSPGSSGYVTALAINPAGTELAVAMGVTGIQLVNLTTNTAAPLVSIFGGSEAVTFSPSGTTVYVSSGNRFVTPGNGSVAVVTVASNSFAHAYVGLTEPFAAVATLDGTELFTADQPTEGQSGAVGVVNLSSGATTFLDPNIYGFLSVTLSPDGSKVYAVDGNGSVTILNESSKAQVGTITGFVANPDTVRPFGNTAPTPPPPPPPVKVTTTSLPVATQSVYYGTQLGATNGVSPYTWTLTGGALPAGLSLAPSGAITGTPSATAATSTFTVQVADSESPADTGTATLTVNVGAASTAPPSCATTAGTGSGLTGATACASGSNTTPGGTAAATSKTTTGSVSVTAHGTGGITVGQYSTAPTGGVPFRAASNSFDVALSSLNTFTSVSIVDCALAGATSLQWWNPAALGGLGAWQAVSPATYNRFTHCLTITLSTTSSPTLAELTGTGFAGVLPSETVSLSIGGSHPYAINGQVVSGAITIATNGFITKVAGTVVILGADGAPVTVTVNASCFFGICRGTFTVADGGSGVSFTTPTTFTLGSVNANAAGGNGFVYPGPGLQNAYPLSWKVTVSDS